MEVGTESMSSSDLTSKPPINFAPIATDVPASAAEEEEDAALKVQKVYRSHRARRMLADCAVAEGEALWRQVLNFARSEHSTISFFKASKPEPVSLRWSRVSSNASKVGKGLSKDAKAQKLIFFHWLEAVDPRHRYGKNLQWYYAEWSKATTNHQPFFYWLDLGDGKEVDLEACPRSILRQQCIKYLTPEEREYYEYIVVEGKLVNKKSGEMLDTKTAKERAEWIYVMSTCGKFYSGQKKKGLFQHSSFLAGGAITVAGILDVEDGVLKSIRTYSGHYHPSEDTLDVVLSFLRDNGVDLDQVQILRRGHPIENNEENKLQRGESTNFRIATT